MIQTCPSCGARNRVVPARLNEKVICGKCGTEIPPPSEPYDIDSAGEFDELIRDSPLPVFVDFWAAWCGPCRMVAPEVAKLARDRAGKVVVTKLDTEKLPDVANRYGIRGIPAFILFRDGQVAARTSGAQPATEIARALGL